MPERDQAAITIRAAVEHDTPTLLRLIQEMAAYEGQAARCAVTETGLRDALFRSRPLADAILAEADGQTVGFALFFSYFAPYPGVPAIFMELLYVVEARRGQGIGRALLRQVARIAVERGADRLEWGVQKVNEAAIGFYGRLGARFTDDFMACSLTGEPLRRFAATG
jgi:GNAT superfamily N-acetyltransferase